MTSKEQLEHKWIQAASDVLEFNHDVAAFAAAGGPAETVKLCLFATLVPGPNHQEYMDKMTALHRELAKMHLPMVSSRPDKLS